MTRKSNWQTLAAPIRCEIPAYTDRWMKGDRYGTAIAERDDYWRVKLDKSGQTIVIEFADCRVIQ